MKSNMGFVEVLVRLVITFVLAVVAVWTEMFVFMVLAMLVVVTALSQWCPLYQIMGKNKDMVH